MITKYFFQLILIIPSIAFSHGVSETDKAEMVHGGLMDYMYLGAKHMITGYDHILFLIGVIFFLTRFTDIVKFVTAFTIGHSITLIFATIFEINANYYLIDAVIAFSVIYKGFENLDGFNKWLSIKPPNLVVMVFTFGLIHGFGLSTRLQQIALGHHNLVYKILSFNAGVEIGQILALAIVFPILLLLRNTFFDKITTISNWALIVAGTFLLVYQLNGYFTTINHLEVQPKLEEKLQENPPHNHHSHPTDDNHGHSHQNGHKHHHDKSDTKEHHHKHDDLDSE